MRRATLSLLAYTFFNPFLDFATKAEQPVAGISHKIHLVLEVLP